MTKMTKEEVQRTNRNTLGDELSWRSLWAVQQSGYETREEAIVDALLFCSRIDHHRLAQLLLKEFPRPKGS